MRQMKAKRHCRLPSGKELTIGEGTLVMGILNVTPDSFSDGGKWNTLDKALDHALSMVEDGAAIIDVGAESSRPGFVPVSAAEEIERLAPFLEHIAPKIPVPISIDTFKAETARAAVELGADILNDIWGLQYAAEERGAMARVAAECRAPVVVMHNQAGTEYRADIIAAMQDFFRESCAIAEEAGVAKEHLIFDPGIGFGKTRARRRCLASRRARPSCACTTSRRSCACAAWRTSSWRGKSMDRIELSGMEFFGYHGCYAEERRQGQRFVVDAVLHADLQEAGRTDRLAASVDYATVFEDVREVVEGAAKNLIEAVAEEIAAKLLEKYELSRVEVAVHKPEAPIAGIFHDVCVRIERSGA